MRQPGLPSRTFGEHFYSLSTSSGFRLHFPSSLEGINRKHSGVVVSLLWPKSPHSNEIVWKRFVTSGTCEANTASDHARMVDMRPPVWGLWCWLTNIYLQRKYCVGRQISRIQIQRFLALCVLFPRNVFCRLSRTWPTALLQLLWRKISFLVIPWC
jgi:hypothetical protein